MEYDRQNITWHLEGYVLVVVMNLTSRLGAAESFATFISLEKLDCSVLVGGTACYNLYLFVYRAHRISSKLREKKILKLLNKL